MLLEQRRSVQVLGQGVEVGGQEDVRAFLLLGQPEINATRQQADADFLNNNIRKNLFVTYGHCALAKLVDDH